MPYKTIQSVSPVSSTVRLIPFHRLLFQLLLLRFITRHFNMNSYSTNPLLDGHVDQLNDTFNLPPVTPVSHSTPAPQHQCCSATTVWSAYNISSACTSLVGQNHQTIWRFYARGCLEIYWRVSELFNVIRHPCRIAKSHCSFSSSFNRTCPNMV